MPADIHNGLRGQIYGLELTAHWAPTERWRMLAWYSLSCTHMEKNGLANHPGLLPPVLESFQIGYSPRNQARIQSSWNICENVEIDAALRYVDSLHTGHVPSYITMDLRLGWRPREGVEFSVSGFDLLDDSIRQIDPLALGYPTSYIRRTVFANMTLEY